MHVIIVKLTGITERSYLLQSYMKSHNWGHLEMHMLLAGDITYFDTDGIQMNTLTDKDEMCPDLHVSLLISRCPVGPGVY